MLSTTTVIILVSVFSLLLVGYYIFMKFRRAGMWYGLSQSESLELMKQQMADEGYDTKTIDFWVEQEMMMMEQHRRKIEDLSIKHDSLFFACWAMLLIVLILLFSK